MSKFGGSTGPLSRTGLALSLVILRGALQNMLAWVHDDTPSAIRTGVEQLIELRRGRVKEIVELGDDDWPGETLGLQVDFAMLADDWMVGTPAEREANLRALISSLDRWLAQGEAHAA